MAYSSIPRSSLVREYRLDGSAVDTNDGTKSDGTRTNITDSSDSVGYNKQSASFNGSSSKITITNPLGASQTALSISWRVKIASTSGFQYLMGPASSGIYFVYNNSNSKLEAKIYSGSYILICQADPDLNKWHDYTYEWSTSQGNAKLYVDNVLVSTSGDSRATSIDVSQALTLGTYNGGAVSWYNGLMQDVRFRNAILTETERLQFWHEFNRKLGGGSDTGAYIPAPAALYDMKDAINLATSQSNTPTSVTTNAADYFGLNRCMTFDGSASRIDLTYAANPISSSSFSLGFILKTPSSFGTLRNFYWQSGGGGANGIYPHFNNSGQLGFGNSSGNLYTDAALSTSTWYAIVMTVSGTSVTIKYRPLSGGSIVTKSGTVSPAITPGNSLNSIGYNPNSAVWYYLGSIAHVEVHDFTLSSDQANFLLDAMSAVNQNYPFKRSLPKALQAKLWGWYDGTNDGTYIKDLSGNGRDLTMVSSPTKLRSFQNSIASTNGTSYAWRSEAVSFSQLSLVQWMNTTIGSATGRYGCAFTSNDAGINPRIGLRYCEPTTKASMDMWDNGSNYRISTSVRDVNDGKWHFVAGTRNGTSAKLYFDGCLEDSDTFTSATITGPNFAVGANRASTVNSQLNGFHETFVFDSELTAQELQMLRYATFRF